MPASASRTSSALIASCGIECFERRLATETSRALGCGHRQDRGIDQPVMHDQPRRHHQPRRAQGQQVGIAGAGADEIDCSGTDGWIGHGAQMGRSGPSASENGLGAG